MARDTHPSPVVLSVEEPKPLHQNPKPSDFTENATFPAAVAEPSAALVSPIEQAGTLIVVFAPVASAVNVHVWLATLSRFTTPTFVR